MYTMKRNSGNSVYAFDMGDSGDYDYQGNQKNKLQYIFDCLYLLLILIFKKNMHVKFYF